MPKPLEENIEQVLIDWYRAWTEHNTVPSWREGFRAGYQKGWEARGAEGLRKAEESRLDPPAGEGVG